MASGTILTITQESLSYIYHKLYTSFLFCDWKRELMAQYWCFYFALEYISSPLNQMKKPSDENIWCDIHYLINWNLMITSLSPPLKKYKRLLPLPNLTFQGDSKVTMSNSKSLQCVDMLWALTLKEDSTIGIK